MPRCRGCRALGNVHAGRNKSCQGVVVKAKSAGSVDAVVFGKLEHCVASEAEELISAGGVDGGCCRSRCRGRCRGRCWSRRDRADFDKQILKDDAQLTASYGRNVIALGSKRMQAVVLRFCLLKLLLGCRRLIVGFGQGKGAGSCPISLRHATGTLCGLQTSQCRCRT